MNVIFNNFIYFFVETRQQGRFAGFSLYVSLNDKRDLDSLCYEDGPQLPSLNFTRACGRSGQFIIFYNYRSKGYEPNAITELCEVFVYGKASFLFLLYILIVIIVVVVVVVNNHKSSANRS